MMNFDFEQSLTYIEVKTQNTTLKQCFTTEITRTWAHVWGVDVYIKGTECVWRIVGYIYMYVYIYIPYIPLNICYIIKLHFVSP
jgi:hypothetical protein